jgi:hypothetical protein
MIPITLGLTASEARVQPPWHGMPFPQSRMPASIEFSIKLFVCNVLLIIFPLTCLL